MVKRTMYFYDKKQADLIKKVNDKLHRSRGIKIIDVNHQSLDGAIAAINNVISELKLIIGSVKKEALKNSNSIVASINKLIVFCNQNISDFKDAKSSDDIDMYEVSYAIKDAKSDINKELIAIWKQCKESGVGNRFIHLMSEFSRRMTRYE